MTDSGAKAHKTLITGNEYQKRPYLFGSTTVELNTTLGAPIDYLQDKYTDVKNHEKFETLKQSREGEGL